MVKIAAVCRSDQKGVKKESHRKVHFVGINS